MERRTEQSNQAVFVEPKPERKWNPGTAAIWSLFIPGTGQMYKSQIVIGLLWIILVPCAYFFGIGITSDTGNMKGLLTGPILHLTCLAFAAYGGDPYTGETSIFESIIVGISTAIIFAFLYSIFNS